MNLILLPKLILLPLFVSFLIAFITTPLAIKIAWRFQLLDDPKKRKHPAHLYKKVIPRNGGLPVYLALLISSLIFLPLDRHLAGILAGATVMMIVGVLDDRFDLNPYLRLATCSLAAGLIVLSGIGISFITNPFDTIINLSPPLAILFAVFWIVFLSNIVNWAKGFDGQLPGIVVIASLTIALLAMKFSADIAQWPVAILASITAGAYLGFLPFNFYPQKIMPGYGGGTIAGFMLAVLAILSTTKVGTAIVVLGVPIIDALYSISRRLLAGRSPFWGDRGHLHHRLLDEWGWGKRRAALFYWLITALLGVAALYLRSRQKFYTIVMLAILIGGLLLWLNFFRTLLKRSDQNKP